MHAYIYTMYTHIVAVHISLAYALCHSRTVKMMIFCWIYVNGEECDNVIFVCVFLLHCFVFIYGISNLIVYILLLLILTHCTVNMDKWHSSPSYQCLPYLILLPNRVHLPESFYVNVMLTQ